LSLISNVEEGTKYSIIYAAKATKDINIPDY